MLDTGFSVVLRYLFREILILKRQPHKMVKLKQFVNILPTNCLSVFDHFVGLALKELIRVQFFIGSNPSVKIF